MRKRVAFIFICISCTAQAQLTFHPKGGLTLATLSLQDKSEGQQAKTGFVGGIGVNIPLTESPRFSIQPELLFVQKGFRRKAVECDGPCASDPQQDNSATEITQRTAFNYLEIPLLAKLTLGSESLAIFFNAGPYAGYWLSGKSETRSVRLNGQIPSQIESMSYSFSDADNRWNYGFQAGAGVGLRLGPGMLTLEGRYSYALSNLQKDPTGTRPKADLKSQHRVIMVMIGYQLPLGAGSK